MLQGNGKYVLLGEWTAAENKITKLYKPDDPLDWSGLRWPGNVSEIPIDTPSCDWKGELCELQKSGGTTIYIIISLVATIGVLFALCVLCGIRKYLKEAHIQAICKVIIDWGDLSFPEHCGKTYSRSSRIGSLSLGSVTNR